MKKIILGIMLGAASTTCIAPAFASQHFTEIGPSIGSLSGSQIALSMLIVMALPCLNRGRKKPI